MGVGVLKRFNPVHNSVSIFRSQQCLVLHLVWLGKQLSNGGSGESDRHKRLKEYVAQHPEIIGLGSSAKANVEYRFTSGDRADVVLTGGGAAFTAVEVELELEGAKNLVVGAYQAIKYAILVPKCEANGCCNGRRYTCLRPCYRGMWGSGC